MLSISSHIQSWLDRSPSIREYLAQGLINHSALARTIKVELESKLGEKVSVESITIALNRAGKDMQATKPTDPLSFIGDVSVQTGLTILNYEISAFDTLELPDAKTRQKGYFVSTRGIWHASIITSTEIADNTVLTTVADEIEENITSTTIRLKPGHISVPGVCSGILSLLSNKGVNFKEVISTHNEMTVLTDQSNAETALQVLLGVKNVQSYH